MNFRKMVEHMAGSSITKVYCPRCGKKTMEPDEIMNPLSRVADIHICNECGTAEAMLDFFSPGANEDEMCGWACLYYDYGKENGNDK